eukprot:Phypoly_transcript_03379.p1 GENE.Phypoly_transcript_03379~~Phypoly_transcript_03379.p1  ORF type:complete len:694 (+),score=80.95 Phypoly_transcript_03379:340-2421(+)
MIPDFAKGMSALFTVNPTLGYTDTTENPVERIYYIAAEEVGWNYAPSPINPITNQTYTDLEASYATPGIGRIGPIYKKARYVEYTNGSFSVAKKGTDEWQHLGLLGPVLRAEVGDYITIHFQNKAKFSFNLAIDPLVGSNAATIARTLTSTGETTIYKWQVPPSSGPTNDDVNSMLLAYSSITSQSIDISSGLVGPLIITKKNQTDPISQRPYGVDREFVLLISAINENLSPYLSENMANYSLDPSSVTFSSVKSSNLKESINGYIFGNLPGLTMQVGDRVRWYTMDMGDQLDYHNAFWAGQTVVQQHRNALSAALFPGISVVSDMIPNSSGQFILDCHMMQHITHGMQAIFTVLPSGVPYVPAVTGVTRYYYIAADEVEWDYTPLGYNRVYGRNFTEEESVQTTNSNSTVGSKYLKALYREYTDSSFSSLVQRSSEWKHMGLMGPAIRGVVGDKIVVTFKNNARFNFSVTPTGLLSLPEDNQSGSIVFPNQTFTYTWYITESAGPKEEDTSSIMWFYRSTVNEVQDMHTGLFGPIVVSSKKSGKNPETVPEDVDREFFVTTTVIDESISLYYDVNLATYLPPGATPENPFELNAINGYLFGNLEGLEMKVNERVRWYSFVLGGLFDIHTPHWHGQTLISEGKRIDTQTIQAGTVSTLDTIPDNPGIWLFHCHVNEHILEGMSTLFTVHNISA